MSRFCSCPSCFLRRRRRPSCKNDDGQELSERTTSTSTLRGVLLIFGRPNNFPSGIRQIVPRCGLGLLDRPSRPVPARPPIGPRPSPDFGRGGIGRSSTGRCRHVRILSCHCWSPTLWYIARNIETDGAISIRTGAGESRCRLCHASSWQYVALVVVLWRPALSLSSSSSSSASVTALR